MSIADYLSRPSINVVGSGIADQEKSSVRLVELYVASVVSDGFKKIVIRFGIERQCNVSTINVAFELWLAK